MHTSQKATHIVSASKNIHQEDIRMYIKKKYRVYMYENKAYNHMNM